MNIPLAKAEKWAELIVDELSPFCEKIEIAGSIRRRKSPVHDIDIVCLADQPHQLRKRASQSAIVTENGAQIMRLQTRNGVQVDIYFAIHPERTLLEEKPGNWGSLFLCRTGSAAFNQWLCSRAISMGLHWNPHHGLFRGKECIAGETENDIFQALDLDYINPTDRER